MDRRASLLRLVCYGTNGLIIALEAKSPYFTGTATGVGDVAASIATQMGLEEAEVEQVRMAGRLRELGGLAADAIPLGSQIIAVAEAFDSITSPRPHKERAAPREAVARIRPSAGTGFDPAVVEALASAVGRRQTLEFVASDGETDDPSFEPRSPGSTNT